ncbi:hypothetical protein TNCV_1388001 [Trichonephila clavipes]|nr:hypothetical protein TNCV_1388001 [Trichonephila clavipes]
MGHDRATQKRLPDHMRAADSVDGNEMNNETPVPTSSEIRNIVKRIRSYFDEHSNAQMNNKMDDIEPFVDDLMLK